MREQIRKVLLHEFRHHLESLAGERDLEVEDMVSISQYRAKKQKAASAEVSRKNRKRLRRKYRVKTESGFGGSIA